jgi:hypothetical protein
VRLRRAMQQQHRRSRAADERVDDGAAGVQLADFEAGKQPFVEAGLLLANPDTSRAAVDLF